MLIRLGLFGALFFSIFWGIVDTFMDPTPENAAEILNPSAESIETSRGLVDPFLEWVDSLNLEAVKQLFVDADADVRSKLEKNPLPIAGALEASAVNTRSVPDASGTRSTVGAEVSTGEAAPPAGDPGIDWYMQRETTSP